MKLPLLVNSGQNVIGLVGLWGSLSELCSLFFYFCIQFLCLKFTNLFLEPDSSVSFLKETSLNWKYIPSIVTVAYLFLSCYYFFLPHQLVLTEVEEEEEQQEERTRRRRKKELAFTSNYYPQFNFLLVTLLIYSHIELSTFPIFYTTNGTTNRGGKKDRLLQIRRLS